MVTLVDENIKSLDSSSVIKTNSSQIKTQQLSRIRFQGDSTLVNMVLNDTETTTILPTEISLMFFSCPYAPNVLWDLNGTTLSWILLGITCIASPATVILNNSVIIAVKQRKELQHPWTTLLFSLAITDFLVGAVNLPLSAGISLLVVHQIWLEHVCLLDMLDVYSMYCLSMCSLYHLTAIAWDRYMAVAKWREYKVIVSKSLVKRLAIIAWFLAIFLAVSALIMKMLNVDAISEAIAVGWCVCAAVALILIFSFYFMVYRGIRKRNINEISRVTSLIKAKLERKIAKTAALLTGALIFSFLPAVALLSLSEVFPVFHTSTSFLLWETLIQLNSLVNPLLYCCRDRRFKHAVLELLRIRKPPVRHPRITGAVRNVRPRISLGAYTVKDTPRAPIQSRPSRLLRTESFGLAVALGRGPGICHEIMFTRSLSAPTLDDTLTTSPIFHNRNRPRLSL